MQTLGKYFPFKKRMQDEFLDVEFRRWAVLNQGDSFRH